MNWPLRVSRPSTPRAPPPDTCSLDIHGVKDCALQKVCLVREEPQGWGAVCHKGWSVARVLPSAPSSPSLWEHPKLLDGALPPMR